MMYLFHAYGHPNIFGTHKTTFEFTKDSEVTLKGDCIIAVKADFDLKKIKKFIKSCKNNKITIKIIISNKKIQEKINAEINPRFSSNHEFVVRKTDFASSRTFAIKANKAAIELNRDLINFLKEKKNKIIVIIENKI